ncbi:hypothetical protein L7F22_004580 [Adiantum nelumboides]|nr:hypothetical protein [Adiantum nelumboides]
MALNSSTSTFTFPTHYKTSRLSTLRRVGAQATLQAKDPFWRKLPVYSDVEEGEFLDYRWQLRNSIKSKEQAIAFLKNVIPDDKEFHEDVTAGIDKAPMSITLTPYILSCINWKNAMHDPLRKQFLPLASTQEEDHPMTKLDSLSELLQSPVPGLVQRYPDKATLLSTTVCPLYCRFCFRSYFVGSETTTVEKKTFDRSNRDRWDMAFDYLRTHPSIEDLTVTGGDTFFLSTSDIDYIGTTLLSMPHIRCFRFNTRGLTAAPMRVLSDHKWRETMIDLVRRGREKGKHVAIHLHFNHPNELSWITEQATLSFFKLGVTLRNQSVLLRGVNDSVETMSALIKKLSANNIHPYYVFQGEMIKGVEDLRTPLSTVLDLERQVQGLTTGFNIPKFVLNSPIGGKHLVGHYDTYDPEKGVSTFKSSFDTNKGAVYTYCDPLDALSPEMKQKWLEGSLP